MVGLAALLALAVVVGLGGYAYVEYRFHQIHREHVAGLAPITRVDGRSASQTPYNILLVGDNCRNCLAPADGHAFGSAADIAGGRSDVTMLLHVDPNTRHVAILSIPRDLWLPIPNSTGEIRVDAALNHGPGELVATIEDALNIPINHYVELNFDTFRDVVNALGGLNIDFPDRAYDAYSLLNVPAGCFHLNGTQVLQVVRARHFYYEQNGRWNYDGLGDISRIQRDHEFLKVLAAAVSAKGLGDPVTDNSLVSGVAKDLTIDDTFSLGSLAHMASTFGHIDLGAAPQRTLPVDEDNSPSGFTFQGEQFGDVVFPTNTADRAAIAAFLGTPASGNSLPANALPVTVVNGSGISGQAATTSAALKALGFHVAGARTGQQYSTPAETVVYYAPGHEANAQRLAEELGGAVSLGQDAAIAGSGLTLVTGTNMTVARPASAQARTHVAHPAGPPSAAVIGGITATNPTYPSFDPTACPAGATATSLPKLAVPDSSILP
ncbi:MAG: LCP family protein [Jatrophihabitantaceae bacterium]